MARRPRIPRSARTQPHLPFRAPSAAVPATPEAPPPPTHTATRQSFRDLVEALLAAWNADDWSQIHTHMEALKDHEGLKTLRWIDGQHGLLFYRIASLYWEELATYWRAQAEQLDQAIETVIDRLGALGTYEAGEVERQAYVAWLREHGHPDGAPWETDPAWFAAPDIIGFVCDTLELTPYYAAKVQRALAAMAPADVPQAAPAD